MEKLPVIDYEGSDYQTSFWERGGRAYEDAAEGVALKRMLPTSGRCMLELGAGAGRNTPRYHGFEQVVLLDYSLTQLQQARSRLGESGEGGKTAYRFVAADIYRLPFVPNLFDTATMIRVLHHMVDPRRALDQVRQSLSTGAVFILEYANKQNLKAVARYLFRRQAWSPFSPEPVEFTPLNFDFHPATVRTWLQATGFVVERQITVSHFRVGVLKRWVPTGVLTGLDSLAQLTGNLWQLTPSVFVRSQARPLNSAPDANPWEQGAFFRCPACGHAPLPDTPPELTCPSCGKTYPVVDGIYDFRAASA